MKFAEVLVVLAIVVLGGLIVVAVAVTPGSIVNPTPIAPCPTSTHESETGAPAQRSEREDGVSR